MYKKIQCCIFLVILITSCTAKKGFIVKDGYWAQITDSEVSIYSNPSNAGDVKKVLVPGSIVFIGETVNEYTEIYTYDPRKDRDEDYIATYRFYAKHPSFVRTSYTSNSAGLGKIIEPPFDSTKNYIRGERGGCYYINSNNNKTYVPRAYCSGAPINNTNNSAVKRKSTPTYTSTCGARTKSGGYCKRKVKGGGRCYQH